jgi:hypothetical protein
MSLGRAIIVCAGPVACGHVQVVYHGGNMSLPPCIWPVQAPYDCSITGPDMAINMMANPPDRQRQPNAYAEYRECERERRRASAGSLDR